MPRWEPDATGRLAKAALILFDQQGYDETTVAEIAARAGLTKRTFFRYFSDKREVLFGGSDELERLWVAAVVEAPDDAGPLAAVEAGLDAVAEMFAERHSFAQIRARVVLANPELRERELIKLERLASAVAAALEQRELSASAASLAAQTGVRVFQVAFARWVAEDDPVPLGRLIHESLNELRGLLTSSAD